MRDVVERAKDVKDQLVRHGFLLAAEITKEQSDEITRLRADVARLREALEEIANGDTVPEDHWCPRATHYVDVARAALTEGQSNG